MSISEVRYNLKEQFEYAHPKDGPVKAQFVTLRAPSYTDIRLVAALRQFFTRAAVELQERSTEEEKEQTKEDDSKLTGGVVISILESSTVDMGVVFSKFEKVILSPTLCQIEGETNFTDMLLERLSIEDMYGLMGDYYANFITASLME